MRGGKRTGSGRKPKAAEISLIEQMDAVAAPELAWKNLWKLCKAGDAQALKVWLNYRFGMPKQKLDVEVPGGVQLVFLKSEGCDPLIDEEIN